MSSPSRVVDVSATSISCRRSRSRHDQSRAVALADGRDQIDGATRQVFCRAIAALQLPPLGGCTGEFSNSTFAARALRESKLISPTVSSREIALQPLAANQTGNESRSQVERGSGSGTHMIRPGRHILESEARRKPKPSCRSSDSVAVISCARAGMRRQYQKMCPCVRERPCSPGHGLAS